METSIVKKVFAVQAAQERVWELLGRAILDSFSGLEKMDFMDENNFRAELKVRSFGIPLTMGVRGEIVDISPPESLSVRLVTRTKWNIINLVQRVSFTLNADGGDRVTVNCEALGENLGYFIRWLLLKQVRIEAEQIFDTIKARLTQWA